MGSFGSFKRMLALGACGWGLVKLTYTRVTFLRLGMALTLSGIMKEEMPALRSRGTIWGRKREQVMVLGRIRVLAGRCPDF